MASRSRAQEKSEFPSDSFHWSKMEVYLIRNDDLKHEVGRN